MLNDNEKEMYERWGKTPPSHTPHGDPDDIKSNLQPVIPKRWRQEGNMLIGETEIGRIAQTIPTNKMLAGTDENGLPILVDVVL